MKVLSKIIVFILLLGVFSSCHDEEEVLPPGSSSYYYYVTVTDASGNDMLDPDNQSNVINCLSLVIDGIKSPVYTVKPEDTPSKYGLIQTLDGGFSALGVGPFQTLSRRDKNIVLNINGKTYNIKSEVRIETVEEGSGQFIYDDIYLNGELLEFLKAPVVIPITI